MSKFLHYILEKIAENSLDILLLWLAFCFLLLISALVTGAVAHFFKYKRSHSLEKGKPNPHIKDRKIEMTEIILIARCMRIENEGNKRIIGQCNRIEEMAELLGSESKI